MDPTLAPVSFDTAQIPQMEPVSFDTGSFSPSPTPEVGANRAIKAKYGLSGGPADRPYDDIYSTIMSNGEGGFRQDVASHYNQQRAIQAQQELIKAWNQPGVTTDQIKELVSGNYNPYHPNTVLEEQFAKKYTDNFYTAFTNSYYAQTNGLKTGSWLDDVIASQPQMLQRTVQGTAYVAAQREIAMKHAEDAENAVKNQSYIGRGLDMIKNAFQLYQEAKLRGNIQGILPNGRPWYGGLMGDYLEGKVVELLAGTKDLKDFEQKMVSIGDNIQKDNPALAAVWYHAVAGSSISEGRLNNLFSVLAAPDVASLGKIALKPLGLFFNTQKAAQGILKALPNVALRAPPIVASDAVGDLAEAAIKQHTLKLMDILNGKPATLKEAVNSLTTGFRTDIESIASYPSRYGQEILNRMNDSPFLPDYVKALVNRYKIDRTPSFSASDTQSRLHREQLRGMYQGPNHSVLDVDQSIWDDLHNVKVYRVSIGTGDGELWKSEEAARQWTIIHGFPEAKPERLVFKGEYDTKPTLLPAERGATIESRPVTFLNREPQLPAGFKTKTRSYTINQNGSTIRKAEPPGIDTKQTGGRFLTAEAYAERKLGVTSTRTVYMSQKDIGNLKLAPEGVKTGDVTLPRNTAVLDHGDSLSFVIPHKKQGEFSTRTVANWRKTAEDKLGRPLTEEEKLMMGGPAQGFVQHKGNMKVPYETEPKVGLVPVELHKPGNIKTDIHHAQGFKDFRIGDPITELTGVPDMAPSVAIQQKGLGYYVELTHYLNETDDIIKNGILELPSTRLPTGFNNTTLGALAAWIRTPEDVLSRAENSARHIAVHGPSTLFNLVAEASKPISKLSSKQLKAFSRLVQHNQDEGIFFKGSHEVEDWYQRNIGREATVDEVHAYFAYQQNVEMDRTIRNVLVFRSKARVGAASHQVSVSTGPGQKVSSGFFDGVQRPVLAGEGNILFLGDNAGSEILKHSGSVEPNLRKKWDEMIKNGEARVIEIYDQDSKPLKAFGNIGNQRIKYVVSSNVETKPLSWDQVPREASHPVYDYDYWLRQPVIELDTVTKRPQHIYIRDNVLGGLQNRAMGMELERRFNAIREHIKYGRLDEAKTLNNSREGSVGVDWDEHHGMYKDSRDAQGNVVSARLSPEHEIRLVPRNKMVIDIDDKLQKKYQFTNEKGKLDTTFVDASKTGLSKNTHAELGKRDPYDVFTFEDKGTAGNPLFNIKPAERLDPSVAMNRGLNRVIDSTFKDDLNIQSVNHWMAQHGKLLKATPEEVAASPYRFFANITDNSFKSGITYEEKQVAMATHKMVKDFLGVPSKVDTFLYTAMQRLADVAYTKFGPKVAMVPTKLLPYVSDPLRFMKSVVFNEKMGLFSIPQFFTQFMTHSNIYAMSPQHAPAGSFGTLVYGWTRINNNANIIAHLDELASKFRMPGLSYWKPGELSEFIRELEASGFASIGSEHALDFHLSNKLITNGFDRFLKWGQTPFTLGASSVRTTAFATAYREFRDLNPLGAIGRAERQTILDKAAILDHNMSRAASSTLHTGIMSIPAQFMAYNIRLAELMMGNRLPWQARARLFGFSAMLYGVPLGGIGLSGFPAEPFIRKMFTENGYIPGENAVSTMFNEGIPSAIMAAITGNVYDIKKYGSKGIDPLGEFFSTDKTIMDLMGGAAWSTISHTWAQTSGFRYFMWATMRGEAFPLTLQDFVDPFKEITSVNHNLKMILALNMHQWLSKNRVNLANDISASNALFMGLTGIEMTKIQDAYLKGEMIKDAKHAQEVTANAFVDNWQSGMRAALDNDPAQAHKFFTRAMAIFEMGNFPVEERPKIYERANKGYESQVDRIDYQLFMKNVPDNLKLRFQNIYMRIRQQGQK